MPEQDLPPGAELTNYLNRTAATPTPVPAATPVPTPVPTPTPTPAQFKDTSMTFEQRMARNQLPPEPSPTPFDRVQATLHASPSPVPALLDRAAQLEKQQPALQYNGR